MAARRAGRGRGRKALEEIKIERKKDKLLGKLFARVGFAKKNMGRDGKEARRDY
jgi:hypothetical protein